MSNSLERFGQKTISRVYMCVCVLSNHWSYLTTCIPKQMTTQKSHLVWFFGTIIVVLCFQTQSNWDSSKVLSSAIYLWFSLSSWLLVIDKSLWLMCPGVSQFCSFMGPQRTLECVWRLDVDLWMCTVCGQKYVDRGRLQLWLLRSDSCPHSFGHTVF